MSASRAATGRSPTHREAGKAQGGAGRSRRGGDMGRSRASLPRTLADLHSHGDPDPGRAAPTRQVAEKAAALKWAGKAE